MQCAMQPRACATFGMCRARPVVPISITLPSARLSQTRKRSQLTRVNVASQMEAPSSHSSTSHDGLEAVDAVAGAQFFTTEDSRPVILFDGQCNLCNGGVNFMLDWDQEGKFRYAALQSPAGRSLLARSGRHPDDISSIVLVTTERSWTKSQAVMQIARRLRMPLPLVYWLSQPIHERVRDVVYEWISKNRYKLFGEAAQCRLMQPEWKDRFLV